MRKLFFQYLKRPHYVKNRPIDWAMFFKLFFFFLILALPFSAVSKGLQELLDLNQLVISQNKLIMVLIALLFAPVFEELAFRLLLKPSWRNFMIFATVILLMAVKYLSESRYLMMTCFVVIACAAALPVFSESMLHKVQTFIFKHIAFFFYLSAALFGCMHIFNFEPVTYKLFLAGILIVGPQIVAGIFMGFVRMRFGIVYSMLFHFCMNLLALPLFLHNL
jgi:uncharacterized protein